MDSNYLRSVQEYSINLGNSMLSVNNSGKVTRNKTPEIDNYINEFDSIMKPHRKEVLQFIENGTELDTQPNEAIMVFLKRMYVQSARNKNLRQYTHIQLNERLKKRKKKKTN